MAARPFWSGHGRRPSALVAWPVHLSRSASEASEHDHQAEYREIPGEATQNDRLPLPLRRGRLWSVHTPIEPVTTAGGCAHRRWHPAFRGPEVVSPIPHTFRSIALH